MTNSIRHAIMVGLFAATVLAQDTAGPRGSLGERFKRLDRNGDGKLTQEEIPRLFRQLDTNNDGQVTLAEAREYFSSQRRRPVTTDTENMATHLNVRYAEIDGVDPNLTSLDIYAPKKATRCPVMVYVHGGGWQRGDKSAVGSKAAHFVNNGYVFVSVNYRLVPDVDVPAEAQDVANAVAWVHDNIARYGGNPDAIFLMGHSAGAHLVSLVATKDDLLKTAGKDLSILNGVIELDTQALDVPKMMRITRGFGVYGSAFGDDPALWGKVSPLHHVAKDKGIPPFLMIVADGNRSKLEQAKGLADALKEANVRAEIVEAPDRTHGTLNRSLGMPDEKYTQAIMDFIDSLRGKRDNDKKPPAQDK